MGMLLYMMELNQKTENTAKGATEKKVAPEPTPTVEVQETKVEEVAKEEVEVVKEKKITRSDIMKMNVATVRAYAEQQGIKGANAMSGAELKRILGDKLFEETE